jgi:ABC-type branched-subunit amino acid transport system ATPase component
MGVRNDVSARAMHDVGASTPVLEVDDLDTSYGHVQILFGASLHVGAGEVLALLGANGAGKSTLMGAIAGLVPPSAGTIRLDGTDITGLSAERRSALGVHILPGGRGVFPPMSVRENLEDGAYLYRRDRADQQRRIERVLDLFPALAERLDQAAGSMSGGQQQMLALAIALLHDHRILLVDELSLGLAPVVVQELLGTIEQLRADGVSMIIVEQSLNIALSLADRAVFLEKGRVVYEGDAAGLAEREDLIAAVFLGGEGR